MRQNPGNGEWAKRVCDGQLVSRGQYGYRRHCKIERALGIGTWDAGVQTAAVG